MAEEGAQNEIYTRKIQYPGCAYAALFGCTGNSELS